MQPDQRTPEPLLPRSPLQPIRRVHTRVLSALQRASALALPARVRTGHHLLKGVRYLDPLTGAAVALQWAAALFLSNALAHSSAVTHPSTRALLIASASISGPLTCLGLLRATHRIRRERFQREHLLRCAMHDELTGLPNRAAMRTHLSAALHTAKRNDKPLTCLYLDIDGLRYANTLLGYRAGDELLQHIVTRVSECLAPSDYFSRFGGDKFIILLQLIEFVKLKLNYIKFFSHENDA